MKKIGSVVELKAGSIQSIKHFFKIYRWEDDYIDEQVKDYFTRCIYHSVGYQIYAEVDTKKALELSFYRLDDYEVRIIWSNDVVTHDQSWFGKEYKNYGNAQYALLKSKLQDVINHIWEFQILESVDEDDIAFVSSKVSKIMDFYLMPFKRLDEKSLKDYDMVIEGEFLDLRRLDKLMKERGYRRTQGSDDLDVDAENFNITIRVKDNTYGWTNICFSDNDSSSKNPFRYPDDRIHIEQDLDWWDRLVVERKNEIEKRIEAYASVVAKLTPEEIVLLGL